jgi:4'-phosphopantetheinyl transferase
MMRGTFMSEHDVEVWQCALTGADDPAMAALLSEEELSRAARFHFDRDRRRFVIARGALRTLLGRYLQRDPAGLRFELGANGKPFLPDDAARFNVSHSGDVALVALSRRHECGIDVEQFRATPDLDAIAERFFSRQECDALRQFQGPLRIDAFFRCWTRKEAVVKATGIGLSLSLQSFDVPVGPEPWSSVTTVGSDRWWLTGVPVPDGYAAALAVDREHLRIGFHTMR